MTLEMAQLKSYTKSIAKREAALRRRIKKTKKIMTEYSSYHLPYLGTDSFKFEIKELLRELTEALEGKYDR